MFCFKNNRKKDKIERNSSNIFFYKFKFEVGFFKMIGQLQIDFVPSRTTDIEEISFGVK